MASAERICRLCLGEELDSVYGTLVPLNGDHDIVILDGSVNYFICGVCKEALIKCYEFRERCLLNDTIFRQKFTRALTSVAHAELSEFVTINVVGNPCDVSVRETLRSNVETDAFIEECLVETVEDNDAGDTDVLYEPLLDAPEKADSGSSNGESSSERKKRQKKEENAKNKLPCAVCGKMIARNNINQHLLTHDPNRPKVFCSYCGKSFKDPRRMQLHINSNHTLEKKYPCELCNKVYLRPTSLKDHKLAKHTDDKRYVCSECGASFTSWAQRWHHFKKEHTTVKPYACPYCEWAFKFK
uniref:C2H2-type domain-containing protein n=1 Tax=Anopheles dirus TaxID=7168 RepID=A0A182N2G5_9DIPT